MPKCLLFKPTCSKIIFWSPFSHWSAFGAKMGPPWRRYVTFFDDFEGPRRSPNSPKITKSGVSKFDVFLQCLLEGLQEGFGSQIKAETIQNCTKIGSKRHKSRPPKNHRFYNQKVQEKFMESSSSNKNIENAETCNYWFFIGFYSIICTSAFCTPCRNWSMHVRGEA